MIDEPNICVITEYKFMATDGRSYYYPLFTQGKWYLTGISMPLDRVAKMCNIQEDVVLFLKLKYGG